MDGSFSRYAREWFECRSKLALTVSRAAHALYWVLGAAGLADVRHMEFISRDWGAHGPDDFYSLLGAGTHHPDCFRDLAGLCMCGTLAAIDPSAPVQTFSRVQRFRETLIDANAAPRNEIAEVPLPSPRLLQPGGTS